MKNSGLDETVNSLRRITTTGAVAAAVLLVGAVVLLAASLLFSVARFSPFPLWSIALVLAVAVLAGALVWWRGPGVFQPLPRRGGRTLPTDVILRAPPPAPVRVPREPAPAGAAGRLGAETEVNRLIGERRYDEALTRLAGLEATDPAMAAFVAAKRRAVARRRLRRAPL